MRRRDRAVGVRQDDAHAPCKRAYPAYVRRRSSRRGACCGKACFLVDDGRAFRARRVGVPEPAQPVRQPRRDLGNRLRMREPRNRSRGDGRTCGAGGVGARYRALARAWYRGAFRRAEAVGHPGVGLCGAPRRVRARRADRVARRARDAIPRANDCASEEPGEDRACLRASFVVA